MSVTIDEIKTVSLEELRGIQKNAYRSALKIGKSADTSIFEGDYFKVEKIY